MTKKPNTTHVTQASPATQRKRGLGRGLSALIGEAAEQIVAEDGPEDGQENAAKPTAGVLRLNLDQLQPGRSQPRQDFDQAGLDALALSLKQSGMVQPIIVRPLIVDKGKAGDKYEIVAGERRWRAAQIAQLHAVPVIVHDLNDADALEVAIVENVQRSDLNPIEEAEGYQRLMDEFGYRQVDLAQTIGKSRSHIANMLRFIQASDRIKTHLRARALSIGHARALLGHPRADALAEIIIREGLSVRAAEKLAADKTKSANPPQKKASKNADIRALEKTLADHLGLAVDIDHKEQKGGGLRIRYRTLAQLDAVIGRLMHK